MNIKVLDTIVLSKDWPSHDLMKGDVGAVVEIHPTYGIIAEFVTGSGHTQALLTLRTSDIRPIGPRDILAVRKLDAA